MTRLMSVFAFLGLLLAASVASAQEKTLKEQVVGTWILSSITSTKDGADSPIPAMQGVLTYTADGYFHFVSMRKDLPKIAANDRTKPTPEEAMAVATGALAYTGSYTVDEKTKTIIPTITMATFGNMVGTNQQRVVTEISDTEMKFTNPRTATGAVLNITWKKAPPVGSVDLAKQIGGVWQWGTESTRKFEGEEAQKRQIKGVVVFTKSGRFAIMQHPVDQKPATNPEELGALYRSQFFGSGTYKVEGDKVTLKYEVCGDPSWIGQERKPDLKIEGKTMTWVTPQLKDATTGKMFVDTYTNTRVE